MDEKRIEKKKQQKTSRSVVSDNDNGPLMESVESVNRNIPKKYVMMI